MSSPLPVYILITKMVILLAGALIVYYTVLAAKRTGDQGLWILTAGLILTGLGLILSGVLQALFRIGGETSLAVTSTLTAIGLLFVVYSMLGQLENPTP